MKAIIKIPRKDVPSSDGQISMFSHIEYEVEGTVEEIEAVYQEVMTDKQGYNTREWAKIRNDYMKTGEIHPDLLEGMSKAQKFVINEIKNAFKAIKGEED